MPYTALAFARTDSGWVGADIDLHGVEDLDGVADLMRDAGEGNTVVLFLEEDDEYVAIVRVDGDDEIRAFLSDSRVLDSPGVAGQIFDGELELPVPVADEEEDEDDDDDEGSPPDYEPAGDAALLADLGIAPAELNELCVEEGMLPSDVIYAVCERAGFVDVLESLRGV